MDGYPTKEQILEPEIGFDQAVLDVMGSWKSTSFRGWRDHTSDKKFTDLTELVTLICLALNRPVPTVTTGDLSHQIGQTIVLDDRLSIITTLHELAHYLFGASEIEACRWSVQYFKKVFPGSFAKLHFVGHMVVQKSEDIMDRLRPMRYEERRA